MAYAAVTLSSSDIVERDVCWHFGHALVPHLAQKEDTPVIMCEKCGKALSEIRGEVKVTSDAS